MIARYSYPKSRAAIPIPSIEPLPSDAVQYLSVAQAQRLCFPNTDQFVAAPIKFTPAQTKAIEAASGQKQLLRGQEVWRAMKGGKLQGFFIVDYVIGKHLVIDYAVALSPEGSVKQIEILNYRESYGGEIRNPDWRTQFVGKTPSSRFAPPIAPPRLSPRAGVPTIRPSVAKPKFALPWSRNFKFTTLSEAGLNLWTRAPSSRVWELRLRSAC